MSDNADWMDQLEAMIAEDAPAAFTRYLAANDKDRAAMEVCPLFLLLTVGANAYCFHQAQFKIAKTRFRLEGRNEWYAYRSNAVESVTALVDRNTDALECDREKIQRATTEADAVLPLLKQRQIELQKSLQQQQDRHIELEASDQEHLAGLREAIAEQE